MHKLEAITDQIRKNFDSRTAAREQALAHARQLTRACSLAIRAVHRDDIETMQAQLNEARQLADTLRTSLASHPDLYHAGYTQDALKEFAEANIVFALVKNEPLPEPEALGVEYAAYLNGLGEAASEMRRRCLDIIRHDHSDEAERLLAAMDDVYSLLVTVDYPDAITGGLRRTTDLVRGVTERTRGDLTMSLRQQRLQEALKKAEGSRP